MNRLRGANVNSADLVLATRGWGRVAGAPTESFVLFLTRSPLLDRSDACCQGGLFVWQRHDQNRIVCPVGPVMAYE